MFCKYILCKLLGWREQRSFRNRKRKICWKNGSIKTKQQASNRSRSSDYCFSSILGDPCDSFAGCLSTASAPQCDPAAAAAAAPSPVLNVAALLASGTQVTPQIAMAAQMAALQAKTLAETGIAVPSYYNPSAVNPMKFAEQEKKRKMLWQGKKEGVQTSHYYTIFNKSTNIIIYS